MPALQDGKVVVDVISTVVVYSARSQSLEPQRMSVGVDYQPKSEDVLVRLTVVVAAAANPVSRPGAEEF